MLVRKSKLSRVERINAIVEMTNLKLQDWYENAKLDYGVIGSGYCEYLNDDMQTMLFHYEENGVRGQFAVVCSLEGENDYAFNVWASEANIENDRIN